MNESLEWAWPIIEALCLLIGAIITLATIPARLVLW